MASERKETRQSLDYPCWYDAGPAQRAVECRLLDVSKSGAKLSFSGSVEIPNEFVLYLTRDGKVGRACIVKSRQGNELQIYLLRRHAPPPKWLEPCDDHLEVEA